MATDVPPQGQAQARATPSGWKPYRLNVRQFLKMIEAGVFPDHHNVELLGGMLVDLMTKKAPHTFAIGQLYDTIKSMMVAGWIIHQEVPLDLGDYWRPEPDFALTRGPRALYRDHSPAAADVALVVEVADSSYRIDRGSKWRRYAAVGIPAYWIVNLTKRQIEVYSGPAGQGRSASYQNLVTFDEAAEIPVTIEGREVGPVAARDILP